MNAAVRNIIFGNRPPVNPALRLLWNPITRTMEPAGMAADFTSAYGDVAVIDPTTPANQVVTDRSWFTQSGTSPKLPRDASGTYAWAAHNLLTYSEAIDNASWSKADAGTITANAALSPIGTLTAEQLNSPAEGVPGAVIYQSIPTVVGFVYTFGIWMRGDSAGVWPLNVYNGSVFSYSYVNLTTEWQFFSITATAAGTSVFVYAADKRNQTGFLSSAYAWGAQVNRGSVPTAYVPTTTAAVYTLAQDYDPTLGYALLVEPAATNLCLYARDLTNAAWTKTNLTTALTSVGIEGVANTCTRLTATAANATARQDITSASAARITSLFARRVTGTGAVYVSQGETTGSELVTNGDFASGTGWTTGTGWTIAAGVLGGVAVPSGGSVTRSLVLAVGSTYKITYTISGYAAGGVSFTVIDSGQVGAVRSANGTFTEYITITGACTVAGLTRRASDFTGTIDDFSVFLVSETSLTLDGTLTRIPTASATITNPPLIIRLATSGDAIDVDVVQHETGTVATSPIPTAAASVTRATDAITKVLTALPTLGAEYSMMIKLQSVHGTGLYYYVLIDKDLALAEEAGFYHNTGVSAVRVRNASADSANFNLSTSLDYLDVIKLAGRFKANDFAGSADGAAVATDTSGALPVGANYLQMVATTGGAYRLMQVVIVPRGWSDTELRVRSTQ